MLLEHRQERRALFGLAVRIDERLFDEFLEAGLRESPRRDAFPRLGCVAWHATMIAGLRRTYTATKWSAELLGPPVRGHAARSATVDGWRRAAGYLSDS